MGKRGQLSLLTYCSLLCPGRTAALFKSGKGGREDLRQLSISELLLFSKGWGQAPQSQPEAFRQAKWAPAVGGRRLS